MSKFVRTGPSSYEKRIYRAAVSQKLRNTVLDFHIRTRTPFGFYKGCTKSVGRRNVHDNV